jgi:hypothetical protein
MSRHVLFVLALVTVGLVADYRLEAQQATGAKTTKEQAPAEAAQGTKVETQTKTEEAQPQTEGDAKLISVPGSKALGMSILGNEDAPKALVIVPWKSSGIGQSRGISTALDDSRQPIDKEVFMRVLKYYEMRSTTTRQDGAAAESDSAQAATAAHRRK